jgi:hypothetical protein
MRRWLLIVTLAALSCARLAPLPELARPNGRLQPSATAEPTKTPRPTRVPTATPMPALSALDLEPILVAAGDLPAGYSGAQVRSDAPPMFDELPEAEYEIYQQFEHADSGAGGVTVLLYERAKAVQNAYEFIISGFGAGSVQKVDAGEAGTAVQTADIYNQLIGEPMVDLAFIRCTAVVHIRMTVQTSISKALAYARRLDRRLQSLVCR